jgi:hypothetical protein
LTRTLGFPTFADACLLSSVFKSIAFRLLSDG